MMMMIAELRFFLTDAVDDVVDDDCALIFYTDFTVEIAQLCWTTPAIKKLTSVIMILQNMTRTHVSRPVSAGGFPASAATSILQSSMNSKAQSEQTCSSATVL